VKAKDFDALWKEKNGDVIEVEKSKLRWTNDKKVKLTLKREPNGDDGGDFDKLYVKYDAKKKHCKLTYNVDGKGGDEVVYVNDYIKECDGGSKVVCKEQNESPKDGVHLPVKEKEVKGYWYDKDGDKQDVKNAELIWDEGEDIKITIYLDR